MDSYIFVLLTGLTIGSFTNVLIHRLPRRESIIWPGSQCPECGHKLRPADLVPVLSYIFLRGQCRYCGQPVSPHYLLVELISAICYLLVYHYYGISLHTLAGFFFMTILITAAFSDLQTGLIPDLLTYPGLLLGLILAPFSVGLQSSVIGGLLFGGFYLIIAVASKGGMGGGDVKLAALIGAFTGWQGAILSFVVASLLGGIAALFLLLAGRAGRKSVIKFGPFLALAGAVAFLWGGRLIGLYLGGL